MIEGIDDDSATTRRYRLELTEQDYHDAVRAHRNGLQVSVTGDREERGTDVIADGGPESEPDVCDL